MSMDYTRINTSISSPDIKSKFLTNFRGVDYTKAQLDVADFRASDMQNFIFDDGINQKRNGFNELIKLNGNINGYWEFKDSTGEIHRIAHVGKKIYRIFYEENPLENYVQELRIDYNSDLYSEGLKDRKSFAVLSGNNLYIFAGILIVYGKYKVEVSPEVFVDVWELRYVRDDEHTYIPTTTTNITHTTYTGKSTRASLEDLNLMSKFRYNKMFGAKTENVPIIPYSPADWGANFMDTINVGYQLEKFYKGIGSINIKFEIRYFDGINVNEQKTILDIPVLLDGTTHRDFYSTPDNRDDVPYLNDECKIALAAYQLDYVYNPKTEQLDLKLKFGSPDNGITNTKITQLNSAPELIYQLDSEDIVRDPAPELVIDSPYNISIFNNWDDNGINWNGLDGEASIKNENIRIDFVKGQLIIKTSCDNPDSSLPNISLKFATYNTLFNSGFKKIDDCQIGIVFGYNGVKHLFVSGNELYPNIDWHTNETFAGESSLPNSENFTYFSDLSYSILGDSRTKIQSYIILNDNTLGILKEFSPYEPSLFIREPYVSDAIDASGNVVYDLRGNTYKKLYYKQYMSAIGEGCVSKYATSNLAGSKLFLSENGVYNIQLDFNNINTNQRYAVEASRLINPKLELYGKDALSKATSIVFKNRYYLSMNDEEGTVYVADARFRNREGEEMNDALGFEWWVWKNVHARTWFVDLDGNLGFGDNEGRICLFNDKENFSDNTTEKIEKGGITFEQQNNLFRLNGKYGILNINNELIKKKIIFDDPLYKILLTNNSLIKIRNADDPNDLRFFIEPEDYYNFLRYYEDKEIFYMNVDPIINIKCFVKNIEYIENFNALENGEVIIKDVYAFRLIENVGIIKPNASGKAYLGLKLGKEEIINAHKVDNGYTFQLKGVGLDIDGNPTIAKIVVSKPGIEPLELNDTLIRNDNVKALWFTPFMNMGTSDYSKTLRYLTIVPEHISQGKAKIHLMVKDENRVSEIVQGVDYNTYFSNLNLNSLSFETDFQSSFSQKVKIRNFNFLIICLESDNNKNFAVENINLSYIIGKRNRGVK